jgi:ElaB/YqjD/DUF883 family membrane-anchored ribosome-binding protein
MANKDDDFDRKQSIPNYSGTGVTGSNLDPGDARFARGLQEREEPAVPPEAGATSTPDYTRHDTTSGAKSEAERTKAKAEQTQREVKEELGAKAGQAQQQAKRTLEEAKHQGLSAVEGQKQLFAEQVGGIASALHATSERLHEQRQEQTASYVDQAAGGLDRFSQTLRDRDFGTLVHQVEDFARRQPGVFLGGAAIVGFLLARFLKSSSQRSAYGYYPTTSESYPSRSYGSEPYASEPYPRAGEVGRTEAENLSPGALDANTSSVGVPPEER